MNSSNFLSESKENRLAETQDLEQQQTRKMAIYISIGLIILWLPFYLSTRQTSLLLNGVLALGFCIILPILVQKPKYRNIGLNFFVAFFSIANFYRAYLCGGSEPELFQWNILAPVLAALLIGGISAIFWMIVNGGGLLFFYYLEKTNYHFPTVGGDRSFIGTPEMIAAGLVALAALLNMIYLLSERHKSEVFANQREQTTKLQNLVLRLKTLVADIKTNVFPLHRVTEDLNHSSVRIGKEVAALFEREHQLEEEISTSAQTFQMMSGSLAETFIKINQLRTSFESVGKKRESGAENITNSDKAFSRIEHSDAELEIMLQAVAEIADSAHLYSLNAAIEAAKAGDFGKGFMVVVDAIRDLAAKSSDVVADIRKINKQNRLLIQQGKYIIGSSAEIFNTISRFLKEIIEQIQSIAAALEEQSQRIAEIAKQATEGISIGQKNLALGKGLLQSVAENSLAIQNLNTIAESLEKKLGQYQV